MPVTIVGNNTPTAGGVVYGDGTNYASTAAGTSGQVLTSNGAGAPTWAAPSTGAMVLVSSATASGASEVVFTNLSTTYRAYMLEYDSVFTGSAFQNLLMQISINNGSSYLATNYRRSLVQVKNTVAANYSANDTVFYIGSLDGFSSVSSRRGSGTLWIFAPNTSGANPTFFENTVTTNQDGMTEGVMGAMTNDGTTSAVNAFKLYPSGASTVTGNFRLYGLVNA